MQRVFLCDVVEQVVLSMKPAAEAKGLRLISVIDPYAGPVQEIQGGCNRIVWNLLTNAIKTAKTRSNDEFDSWEGSSQSLVDRLQWSIILNDWYE